MRRRRRRVHCGHSAWVCSRWSRSRGRRRPTARVVILDEPTSSLEPREVDTLFGDHRAAAGRRRRGAVRQPPARRAVPDLRPGHGAARRPGRAHRAAGRPAPAASWSRRCSAATSRRSGARAPPSSRASTPRRRPSRCSTATGLTSKHRLDGVDVTVRPGEIVGLGGLLGAGRSETAMAIAGALPLDAGKVSVAGKRLRTGSVAAAMRAGVVMLPEDRKADGDPAGPVGAGEHRAGRAPPAVPLPAWCRGGGRTRSWTRS